MSVKDLSQADFQYWKKQLDADRRCHEEEFLQEIDPELMHALYRGYKDKKYKLNLKDPDKLRAHILTISKIFTAVNTILPNLQYQVPRTLCIPENGTDPGNAAMMTAALNHYKRVLNQKAENQEATLSSFFVGLSWKKIGYHVPTAPRVPSPESGDFGGMPTEDPTDSILMSGAMQASIREESPFNTYESPLNVLIDHRATLKDFKVITHRLRRSLQDLYDYGNYDSEMLDQMTKEYSQREGSRFDAREVYFTINEMMIDQRGGIYMLVWADEFDKPLYYEKTTFTKFPWYPLVFTNEPEVRYPTSHLSVASRSQRWVDEIASRYVEIIGRSRNQHYVNQDILAPGQKENFVKNMIGGLIFGRRQASQGDIVEIKSTPANQDINIIMSLLQQDITEKLGADPQKISGMSKNDTLGQDKIAAIGTEIRESGMLDKVRDWLIAQDHGMVGVLQRHSGAQLNLNLTPNDFATQEVAQRYMGGAPKLPISFRTPEQPMPLSHYTANDSYDLIINVYEAVKPDKKEIARELDEFMLEYSNPMIENAMLERGKRVRLDMVAEERAKQFEYINAQNFIEQLDSMQMAAIQTRQMLMKGSGQQGSPPQAKGPTSSQGVEARTKVNEPMETSVPNAA